MPRITCVTRPKMVYRWALPEDLAPLREALARLVVASVGPVCSTAIARHGVTVDVEPEHPKLGALIVALAKRAPALLATKRRELRVGL